MIAAIKEARVLSDRFDDFRQQARIAPPHDAGEPERPGWLTNRGAFSCGSDEPYKLAADRIEASYSQRRRRIKFEENLDYRRTSKSRFVAQQQIEKLQMLYDSLAQEYFGD